MSATSSLARRLLRLLTSPQPHLGSSRPALCWSDDHAGVVNAELRDRYMTCFTPMGPFTVQVGSEISLVGELVLPCAEIEAE